MKKIPTAIAALALIFACVFSLASCFNTVDAEGVWENATYRRDVTLGNGEKTISLTVKAGEDSVTFTVKTDKENLADALVEHDIISGEESDYGLTVYTVNGMTADFRTESVYWALYEGDSMAPYGVSSTEISDGDSFSFVYSAF